MRVATLGPCGTCSEEAALAYVRRRAAPHERHLLLCSTYEEAVDAVLREEADVTLVAAAYVDYNRLTFENIDRLRVREVLYSRPTFLLAGRDACPPPARGRRYSVACHPSPSPLLARLDLDFEPVVALSNAVAAHWVQDGRCDLCITNRTSVEHLNRTSPPGRRLKVLRSFGSVDMVWAVFERGAADDRPGRVWIRPVDAADPSRRPPGRAR